MNTGRMLGSKFLPNETRASFELIACREFVVFFAE